MSLALLSFHLHVMCRLYNIGLRPESGTFSKSGRNPAPAKIPPEPDSFAGFEKSFFPDIR